jgi:leader peptidase (prepilin peptidase)/N-methyltransferase
MRQGSKKSTQTAESAPTVSLNSLADVITSRLDVLVISVTLGAIALLATMYRTEPLQALVIVIVLITSGSLARIDFAEHRLPNRIVGPLAVFAVGSVVVFGALDSNWGRTGSAVLTGVVVFAFLFLAALGRTIGMGDAKLSLPYTTLLAWFGSGALQAAAVGAILLAGAYTVFVLARDRTLRSMIPFGPFMGLGLIIGLWSAAP